MRIRCTLAREVQRKVVTLRLRNSTIQANQRDMGGRWVEPRPNWPIATRRGVWGSPLTWLPRKSESMSLTRKGQIRRFVWVTEGRAINQWVSTEDPLNFKRTVHLSAAASWKTRPGTPLAFRRSCQPREKRSQSSRMSWQRSRPSSSRKRPNYSRYPRNCRKDKPP